MSTKKQFLNALGDALRKPKAPKVHNKDLIKPKHKMVKSRRVK